MARSPRKTRRVYWDSCAWIAQIQNERVMLPDRTWEDRAALCRAIIDDAEKGGTEILTSALTLIEVAKIPATGAYATKDKISHFFENEFIVIVRLDRYLGEGGRELMRRDALSGLKPAEATHLISAAMTNVEEMHMFDVRLLRFGGKIVRADGTNLKICKPSMGGPPMPLLEDGEVLDGTSGEDASGDEAEGRNRGSPDGGRG